MRALVIYSGGMDSFTTLHAAIQTHRADRVAAISFNYGQRHSRELEAAHRVCKMLGVDHRIVNLPIKDLLGGSSLTDHIDIPEGHYAEENMKSTVVPNRNMIMLSIAVGYAVSRKIPDVWCGAHSGDHDIYPDCRAEFFEALNGATAIANYQPVKIHTPFIDLDKAKILEYGRDKAGLNSHSYIDTWTCYNGRDKACGKCGACVERLEAFDSVGWEDPLEYEDRESWKALLSSHG